MAGEQFRTSVSLVFWTADAETAQSEVDNIKAQLPEDDQPACLATIEFIAAGKPEPPPVTETAADNGG